MENKRVVNQEMVQMEKTKSVCPMCRSYAKQQTSKPIAVMCCEGACLKRRGSKAGSKHSLSFTCSRENSSYLFGRHITKNTGQMLVRNSKRVIALEGCFIKCSSRMMKGVIGDLEPEVILADTLYDFDKNLFGIDEMSEEEIKAHAEEVAQKLVESLYR